jgi:hypothetical protein
MNAAKTRSNAQVEKKKDAKVLAQLSKIWNVWNRQGLEARHRTGVLLNQRLGSPADRQAYGQRFLEKVAKHLGLTQGELSRMRWFAFHFESLNKLRRKHLAVTTWSDVKELLPKLNGTSSNGSDRNVKTPANPRKVESLFERLTTSLKAARPDGKSRRTLISRFRRMAKAASTALNLRIQIKVEVA